MSKILIIMCLALVSSLSHGQDISYNQLQSIFNIWKQSKGKDVKTVNAKLKSIYSKWKMLSGKPMKDGETTYYAWQAVEAKGDTSAFAVYIDEDATTVKYSLKYAFHSLSGYYEIETSLNAAPRYKGRITTSTDNSKGETDLLGHGDDRLPMNMRIDFLLSDYDLNSTGGHPRLFTVDIFSRYIPK